MKSTYTRPWIYDKQRAAIFHDKRYGIIEASTKSGKTAGCMIWLTEQALGGQAGHNYWWVAPIFPQAEIVFSRLKRALPRELYSKNDTKLTLTLGNGAVIWFKGADKPDSLYGEDVYAAVIDEASRCKEEAWHAVRSTLTATQGPVRIIGNVKGRKNWAYVLARKAEAGEPGMHYARITAPDAVAAGLVPEDEIADAKSKLPDAVFRELYMAEPSDDQGNPFGLSAIRACANGLSDLAVTAWGWDLAKSTDWTVGVGLDVNGRVARFVRWQKPWEDTIRDILTITGDVPALVDSTGVGDPILERLQKLKPGVFIGFKFSSSSKQQLMEGLAVAIQQQQIHYPADGAIVAELEAFEYVYTRTGVQYSAPQGLHDDCVCALALAVQLWSRHVAFSLYDADPETDAEIRAREEETQRLVTAEAARAVANQIATDGYFWPGGR